MKTSLPTIGTPLFGLSHCENVTVAIKYLELYGAQPSQVHTTEVLQGQLIRHGVIDCSYPPGAMIRAKVGPTGACLVTVKHAIRTGEVITHRLIRQPVQPAAVEQTARTMKGGQGGVSG